MKDLGGVVAEQAIDLVLAVAPVGIEEVRQVLRETDCSESFLSCRGLKQRILFNREMVRFVFPQEDWTVEWRSESAAVYRALEKLSPNDGSVLADFAIPLHRQVNDDDLAGEDIVWTDVCCGAEQLANLATAKRGEPAGKVSVNVAASLLVERRTFAQPVIFHGAELDVLLVIGFSGAQQTVDVASRLPLDALGLLLRGGALDNHAIQAFKVDMLVGQEEQSDGVTQ